jgi:hypothetical protein
MVLRAELRRAQADRLTEGRDKVRLRREARCECDFAELNLSVGRRYLATDGHPARLTRAGSAAGQ